jgi:hypothetical protein
MALYLCLEAEAPCKSRYPVFRNTKYQAPPSLDAKGRKLKRVTNDRDGVFKVQSPNLVDKVLQFEFVHLLLC